MHNTCRLVATETLVTTMPAPRWYVTTGPAFRRRTIILEAASAAAAQQHAEAGGHQVVWVGPALEWKGGR